MTTHPKKATAKKPADKVILNCAVEGCNFSTKLSAFAKQELGRHMKFNHGIPGTSASANLMQSKKAGDIQPLIEKPEPTNGQPKRTYTRRSTINVGYDSQALITVGKIISACEAEAEKLGAPKNSFTQRCAELFYASQIR